MSSQFLKPNDNVASSLSIPNTPNMLNTRRASATMPMSAKLMSLRGDNQTPMKDSDKPVVNNIRFMQKNGRCNIKQEAAGTRERYLRDFFTTLVDMKWRNNLLFYITTYVIAWSFFGLIWYCIALWRGDIMDPEDIESAIANGTRSNCVENVYSYTTAFLFFVETETSVGYGRRAITEECPEAIILFVIQEIAAKCLSEEHMKFQSGDLLSIKL